MASTDGMMSLAQLRRENIVALMDCGRILADMFKGEKWDVPSKFSLHYWCKTGILMPDGSRLFLGWYPLGGRIMTTREAVERFIANRGKKHTKNKKR